MALDDARVLVLEWDVTTAKVNARIYAPHLPTPHPLTTCSGIPRSWKAFTPENLDGLQGRLSRLREPVWPSGKVLG